MLDAAYYLTKNWAIEAICCVAPHHIQGTGTIASDFARAWLFPPSVMAQYHFTNFGAFQPYVGVGVNFTTFWNTRVNNDTWSIPFAPGAPLAAARGSPQHLPICHGRAVLGPSRTGRLRLYAQRTLGRERRLQIYRAAPDGSLHRRRVRAGSARSLERSSSRLRCLCRSIRWSSRRASPIASAAVSCRRCSKVSEVT